MTFKEKTEKLNKLMEEYCRQNVCIAFSGGVDSSVLLAVASQKARENHTHVYAVTFDTMLHPRADAGIAKKVAKEQGAIHKLLEVNEFDNPKILENPVDRCYLCKKMLFTKLKEYAAAEDIPYVLEGTNADDHLVYRPGLRAIEELNILSPLASCEFTKKDVRRLAGEMQLSVAERPSTPCMATRLPYGSKITREVLEKIEQAEDYLHINGFVNVRARVHDDVLRLEVEPVDMERVVVQREELYQYFHSLGFAYVTLDLKGFRSGSMDENIRE